MASNGRGVLAAIPLHDVDADPVPALVAEYWRLFYVSCALTVHCDDTPQDVLDHADASERAALEAVLNSRATSMAGLKAKMRAGNAMACESGGADDVSTKLISSCIRDLDEMSGCVR
jgi:hypothetical protein